MVDQAQSLRDIMLKKKVAQEPPKTVFLAVASGKGGVGKSVITVNIAIAFAQRGKRVLIIDADFGLANVDVMLGVNAKYNLSHVIQGTVDIQDAVSEGHMGVKFISGGSGLDELMNLDEEAMAKLIERFSTLSGVADIIIFDLGAGVNDRILQVIHACSEAIVVMTPEPTSILDAYALIKALFRSRDWPSIRLVVNRAETPQEGVTTLSNFVSVSRKYIGDEMPLSALGHVVHDQAVPRAVRSQTPLLLSSPSSPAAIDINNLADRYLSLPEKPGPSVGIREFFTRFFRKSAG